MNDVRSLLLANLDEAYERKAWHGPNLRGALRGVTAADALRRPGKGRHNIWELVVHAAYWKFRAANRLRGERMRFGMKGSDWFPAPSRAGEAAWRAAKQLLDDEHRKLRDAIRSMPEADLRDAKKLRFAYAIAAHDLYHTGQIQLVKRLVPRQ